MKQIRPVRELVGNLAGFYRVQPIWGLYSEGILTKTHLKVDATNN